jgi:hypothetical protein
MSNQPPSGSTHASPRATIPPGEPEHVIELVRREVAKVVGLSVKEAVLQERAKRYEDLQRRRRRILASIQTREQELRHDRRELEEVERAMEAIRPRPGLKVSTE